MVKEVEDDEPLSYAEGTLQPLTESQAFHYQIKFSREQIEDETNSEISGIEEIKSLPVLPKDI